MSRYEDELLYEVIDSKGENKKAQTFREIDRDYDENNASIHIVRDGDNLFSIAISYYNDVSLWYIIADKNPTINNPFVLTVGDHIIIPSILDDNDLDNDVDYNDGDDDNEDNNEDNDEDNEDDEDE